MAANPARHTRKYRVDQLESLVDLLADFSTSQDNLAADENQENDLGLHHAIDQTREQLRLVGAEVVVTRGQSLQTDGELDVAGADDILDLEIGKLGVETKLLDNTRILARGQLGIILGLGTSDDHLAGGEDESGSLGFTDTHDHGSKTLRREPSSATLYPDACALRAMLGIINTFGLYSALRACSAIVFRSRRQSRLTVATMFLLE